MKEQKKNITKLHIHFRVFFYSGYIEDSCEGWKRVGQKWLLSGALEKLLSAAYLRLWVNDADRIAKRRMCTAKGLWY
jgi:hypothetical protein